MIRRAMPDDVPEIRLLIGRALVQRVEQELSARGQAVLIADVWRDAIPFYGALGWEAPEAVLLRKRLKSRNTGGAE
jgi:hypothetical protein